MKAKSTAMGNSDVYKKYCTGCGLCKSRGFTDFIEDSKGFLYPDMMNEKMIQFCNSCCPMGPKGIKKHLGSSIWGDYKAFWTAYSADEGIRKNSSSGGIITSLCCWLLNNKQIDYVIQIRGKDDNPTDTEVVLSSTEEEVRLCAGSRYSKSSPLLIIDEIIKSGKRYAFVGKPCDCTALRNYMKINEAVNCAIKYVFSFFCAGTPSQAANDRLLCTLGIEPSDCRAISYRGDGWPGRTKAIDKKGNEKSIDYQTAWMDILGRDIRYCCKFCFDSIGENADVSGGDYWYLDSNDRPDFTEKDGRNCVFAWTLDGEQLMNKMIKEGVILTDPTPIEFLKKAQPNHFNRRSTLITKLLIMRLLKKEIPLFSLKEVLKFYKYNSLINHARAAKGTVQRIIEGRI